MSNIAISKAEFFQEAVHLLCGDLDLHSALEHFFSYLQNYVPVAKMAMGRISQDRSTLSLIGYDARSGTVYPLTHEPFSLDRERDARSIDQYNTKGPEGWYSPQEDGVSRFLGRLHSQRELQVCAPLFYLRMQHRDKVVGSAIFTCEKENPFCESHLEYLRLLRIPLIVALHNHLQYVELEELKDQIWQENFRLRQAMHGLHDVNVIGAGGGLRRVMERVRQAAPTDVPVLITGETGTGKEVIAQALHSLSSRHDKSFVAVNCGALPPSLIDSELFGHVKGSFTGAVLDHKGRFERAKGGTIFLDEVAELPLEVQARLLRVLQERCIERVGGSRPIPVDFRLISATNKDIQQMVKAGSFREDLYYRLGVVHITLPPLRERKQDIPILVSFLLKAAAARQGVHMPQLAAGQMDRLLGYDWPGNVRELQNVLEEALVFCQDQPLRFWPNEEKQSGGHSLPQVLPVFDDLQRAYFSRLLSECQGRIGGSGGAAARAGINPHTLRSRLDRLGIAYGRKKD